MMTQEQFEALAEKATPGELWAKVQNYIGQEIAKVDQAKQESETALAEKLDAIAKAEDALKNGQAEKIAEAIAAIEVAKQTENQKQIDSIDKQIAELQAIKDKLVNP